ncbi:putative wall-associated receptor kinase-like 16 [Prunus dulcis]|nr:putative wall-associated receptor kinase-like 16 [Prunus dulcis]
MKRMLIILQLSLVMVGLVVILLLATPIATAAQALPGCQDHCGNLTIPYPFGIGPGCYLQPEFNITCNQSTQPPTANLKTSNIKITNISLEEGELQILQYVAEDCYNAQGNRTSGIVPRLQVSPPYTISHTKNKFYALGCDTLAYFTGYRGNQRYTTGCMSICDSLDMAVDEQDTCSGVGCCQVSIPSGLKNQTVMLTSPTNRTGIWDSNPCSYAFIVQADRFEFSRTSLQLMNNKSLLPAVLNWEIGNQSCDTAKKSEGFACKGNSNCTTVGSAGYICKCMPGYHGNPYHPDGCQDTDECKDSNPCPIGTCINLLGNYSCKCPEGYKNDVMDEKKCIKDNNSSKIILPLVISLGASGGFLLLLVGSLWIYWGMQRRKFIKLKEKYFKENGGLLLQQQLASQGGSMETTKLFTAEELEKATNNYHESRILGEGGYGTVYKGILPDNSVVAIKKSKVNGAPAQSDVFINEVIVLSQIKHRNVVRLLGCCLETPAPLLVYEFIVEGTLSEHIHKKIDKRSSLSWELRLNIATETAGALAYLHSSALMQIIHRDVKATNILLDEHYTAKVSDFGASRLIPLDQTQLTTLVQGTLGYLDPEYFLTNQLTEKSDVYSFGVVLMELLTSKVALSFARPEEDINLANFFVRFMEEDRLNEVLDDDIVNERNVETLKKVAEVAKRCVRLKGQDRPSMKEVAMELEGMRVTPKQPWGKSEVSSPEDTEHLLGSAMNSDAYFVDVRGDFGSRGATIGTTSGYDSMQIQMVMPYDGR